MILIDYLYMFHLVEATGSAGSAARNLVRNFTSPPLGSIQTSPTDITLGSPHCRKGDDLDWPWPWEMARNFIVVCESEPNWAGTTLGVLFASWSWMDEKWQNGGHFNWKFRSDWWKLLYQKCLYMTYRWLSYIKSCILYFINLSSSHVVNVTDDLLLFIFN